jgi:hypothetical protein
MITKAGGILTFRADPGNTRETAKRKLLSAAAFSTETLFRLSVSADSNPVKNV